MGPVLKFWQARGVKFSGMLALGLLVWLIYMLFTSSAFFVYGAEIRGNVAVSAREIYTAGQIDSQSIFWISPAEVERNIEALPNIKSASVTVKLPAQVAIDVAERRLLVVKWLRAEVHEQVLGQDNPGGIANLGDLELRVHTGVITKIH